MKWIKSWIENSRYGENVLQLSEQEAYALARILGKTLKDYRKKLERLQDIHDSGEATERQETLLMQTEENVILIERFINIVEL